MSGLRKAILAVEDRPLTEYPIREWGVSVWLRPMTLKQRQAVESRSIGLKGLREGSTKWMEATQELRLWVVVQQTRDADGTRVFTDEDGPNLLEKNAETVQRLFDAIMVDGKMGTHGEEVGNSGGVPSGALSSDSPGNSAERSRA